MNKNSNLFFSSSSLVEALQFVQNWFNKVNQYQSMLAGMQISFIKVVDDFSTNHSSLNWFKLI